MLAPAVLEEVLDPFEGPFPWFCLDAFPWFCLDADRREDRSRRGAECEEPIGRNARELRLPREQQFIP